MLAVIFIALLAIIAIGCFVYAFIADEKFIPVVAGLIFGVVALIVLAISSFYNQSVGDAKVIINSGGTVAGYNDEPGWATKAPWQTLNNWDLFSQTLTYAGTKDRAPDYTGGAVNGQEVTASAKGGAQAFMDVSVTYNLDGDKVVDLYKEFRNQERFTQQIVAPKILSVLRQTPSPYTPVEFRGEKREEARANLEKALGKALGQYGITIVRADIQDVRFTEQVEESIKQVEIAQQEQAKAEANLRATEVSAQAQIVEAQAQADAARVAAQGQADANALLTQSLTPQVLQQRYIDALSKASTVYVVPEGSTPMVGVPPVAAQ